MSELVKLSTFEVAAALSLFFASAVAWTVIAQRWRRGQAAIEPHQRRTAPWTGVDLIAILIILTATCAATAYSLGVELDVNTGEPEPAQLSLAIMARSIGSVLAVPICASLLVFRWHGTPRDLGLPTTWHDFVKDLLYGVAGFAAVAFPVLLLHTSLAVLLKDIFPYQHKVYETLMDQPNTTTLLLMAFSAVIAAPLWEEFAFRLMLQGWMQKVVHENAAEAAARAGTTGEGAPLVLPSGLSLLPIIGSSLAFASTHIGQGPAPIPIFFLGLVLGYVYRQTQRILPCILLHMLFNSVGIATAWIAIESGQLPQ